VSQNIDHDAIRLFQKVPDPGRKGLVWLAMEALHILGDPFVGCRSDDRGMDHEMIKIATRVFFEGSSWPVTPHRRPPTAGTEVLPGNILHDEKIFYFTPPFLGELLAKVQVDNRFHSRYIGPKTRGELKVRPERR